MLAEIGPWEIGGLILLAIVLFDETLLPAGREHIDKDRIVREMTAYVIHGTQRPAASACHA